MDSQKLHSRAQALAHAFDQGNRVTARYIDEAVVLDREALELCGPDHHLRHVSLTCLAITLLTRYDRFSTVADLEEAILLDRDALSLCPQGHPDRSAALNILANCLTTRYCELGALQDLEEAVALSRETLSLHPVGHTHRSMSLDNLAVRLTNRYRQLGRMQDLEEAIALTREALSVQPPGHSDRSVASDNLAVRLCARYEQLGSWQDLEEAIVLSREALALCSQGHTRSVFLNNLSDRLSMRYSQLGVLQDLEEAIALDREALSLHPPGHPGRSMSLNNLAICLSTRYEQLGALQDLEEGIVLNREALSLRPQGHTRRSSSLNSLANCLSTRYKQVGELQDLEEAITLDREALSLRPSGHPERSMSLNNLASHLLIRYNYDGVLQDLEDAVVLDREALLLHPQGHPHRSESLINLAGHLSARHHHLVSKQGLYDPSTAASDIQEVFTLCVKLADIPRAASVADLDASRSWIRMAEDFNHPSTLLAYETSLRFLVEHLSLLPTLPQHLDIMKKCTSSLAVDAFSACLRNGVPQRAVELLEQGRGVFWNQLTRLRSPLDDVVASGPAGEKLASEFTRLSSLIRMTLGSPVRKDQHEQLCRHNFEMQGVVTAIRNLPGCSRFLLPSLFSDLRRAASEGPVIIVNASQYGCDALVIFDDHDPLHIPLSLTKKDVQHLSLTLRDVTARARTRDATKLLACFLRELWDEVVYPIVRVLRSIYPLICRIWWCPTAEFSLLPLHAAAPYRRGQWNLAELYISSYTPTLGTLIHARRPRSLKSRNDVKRFIGIGQANAPGQRRLFSVSSELANITQCVNDAATGFTGIEGKESCIRRVAEEIGKSEWVHLACHGLASGKQPFQSAFALSDGDFTIERIIRCTVEDPEFAYLSACHTTVGDEESPDEMIHLASAMQFVGFRSVIGTMWAVDDGKTNKVTSTFYSLMKDKFGRLDHTRAAYALNETMQTVDVPLDQRVLYVHIGA